MAAESTLGLGKMGLVIATGETPSPIQNFQKILDDELGLDRARYKPDASTNYRALKETFRSPAFTKQRLSNDDIRSIVDFLLTNETFKVPYIDWIRTRSLEWERHTLPQNTVRIYALGKKQVFEMLGKK